MSKGSASITASAARKRRRVPYISLDNADAVVGALPLLALLHRLFQFFLVIGHQSMNLAVRSSLIA
ncbi:MAG TPA: hypothetical protein VKM93_04530 [Terriglobia bacterium]|nr:hypothetical protein [Terriglobia bacterium]